MSSPRFDGLYRCVQGKDNIHWMRFLPDGTALSSATSPGPASQIACWMRKGAPSHILQGRWSPDGGGFTASLNAEFRTVRGLTQIARDCVFTTGEGGSLLERWTSKSNDANLSGQRGEREYSFVVVAPRYLDGDGSVKEFRSVRGFSQIVRDGADAALVSRLKATRGLKVGVLASAERADLLSLGVTDSDADEFLRWRGGYE